LRLLPFELTKIIIDREKFVKGKISAQGTWMGWGLNAAAQSPSKCKGVTQALLAQNACLDFLTERQAPGA